MNVKDRYEVIEINIGENKYIIHPFAAIEALRIQSVLIQKVGPAIGELLGSLDKIDTINVLDSKIDSGKISKSIELLFSELNENEFIKIILRLLKNTEAICKDEGEKLVKIKLDTENNIDIVFRKNLIDIYKLIYYVLKGNYSDFFQLLEGIGNKIKTTNLLENVIKEPEKK